MEDKTEDNNVKTSFSAMVVFLDDGAEETFDIEISKPVEQLTYDEVEDAVWNAVDKKHGYEIEDFEDATVPYKVIDIVINDDDGTWPVVPEDADIEELKKTLDVEKFLVLPWARYSLTPEAKMWMKLKDEGIISEDAPFDYEKYHKLVEAVNEGK